MYCSFSLNTCNSPSGCFNFLTIRRNVNNISIQVNYCEWCQETVHLDPASHISLWNDIQGSSSADPWPEGGGMRTDLWNAAYCSHCSSARRVAPYTEECPYALRLFTMQAWNRCYTFVAVAMAPAKAWVEQIAKLRVWSQIWLCRVGII